MLCLRQFQALASSLATLEHLTKNHVQEVGLCPHKLSRKAAKIQYTGLIPTQNRFFGVHTECETDFLLSVQEQ